MDIEVPELRRSSPPFPAVSGIAGFLWIAVSSLLLALVLRRVVPLAIPEGIDARLFVALWVGIGLAGVAFLYVGVRTIRGTGRALIVSGAGSILCGLLPPALPAWDPVWHGVGIALILAGCLALWERPAYLAWQRANAGRWRAPHFPMIVRVAACLWILGGLEMAAVMAYGIRLDLGNGTDPDSNMIIAGTAGLGVIAWSVWVLLGRVGNLSLSGVAAALLGAYMVAEMPFLGWFVGGCVFFVGGVLALAGRAECEAWRAGLTEGEGWVPRYPPVYRAVGIIWLAVGGLGITYLPEPIGFVLVAFILGGALTLAGKVAPLFWGLASVLTGGIGRLLFPGDGSLFWAVNLVFMGGIALVDRPEYLAWKRSLRSEDASQEQWREPF
jgi:hypothetical protein